ncbi:MAG: uncharacterized protein KVP18_002095 [Porospora cf. gigantea A]|uniref:uncharacterized protein n=1 Tax=Porospora cf. gigantea A TaxID=2853593 RepID=UPI00355A647C|nr:MAG: hypothetical protein KVP18_002095 [Porospora cf. gigantea A]
MVLPLKVAALSIACVSMAIFGPLESNWSAWQPILAKQGAYDDRCKHEALDEKGMCPSQREALAFLPTFSTSAGFVFALAGGIVKDRYGNRTAVLGGCVLKLAGMIILSISGRTFAGWAWGFFLLGAGDQPIMMGVVDVAHYFPRHKGLIIGVVTLFRNIAVLLPFGVELLVGRYPYTLVLLGYFYIMQLVFLFFVFGVRNMGQFPKLELKSPKKKSLIHTITDPAMWFVAGRPWYIVYASCYMCIAVMVAFYQTSSSYQLGMSIHSAPIYSTLTSLVLSPFFGLLVDNFGVVALTVGTAFPLSLSYLCMTFNHVGTDWAANSMEPIFRSVDRAQVHMVMAKRWPVQLQGRIVGICFAAGGLLGMASPLLLDVAIAGGIQIVNYVFFALSLGVCVALMLVARQYLPDLHKFVQRFAAPDVTVDSALKLLDENFLLVHGRYGFKTELSEMTESADETSHSVSC